MDVVQRTGFDGSDQGRCQRCRGVAAPGDEGKAWLCLGYLSWKDYCKAEFEMSRPRAYQLLDFVEIKRAIEVSTNVDSPQNESQTRALKAVPAEKRAEVWERANEIAGSDSVTAKTHGAGRASARRKAT